MNKQLLLSIVLLCLSSFPIRAEKEFSFRRLDVANGLSDNKVYAIYKDADGFLWFRTEAFMNRYDGVTFRLFHQPRSLQSDLVSSASINYETNREGLIFSTNNENLSIFDPNKEAFLPDVQSFFRKLGMTEKVRMVFLDKDKNYWLRTESESLFYYDARHQRLVKILDGASRYWIKEGYVQNILKIRNQVWIMTDAGMLKCLDLKSFSILYENDYLLGRKLNSFSKKLNSIRLLLCPDSKGNFYVLHDKGVLYFETDKQKWTDLFPTYANRINVFTSMDMDSKGNLWVGTGQEGYFVISKGNTSIAHYPAIQVGYNNYIKSDISCIFIDKNDGVWIGTLSAGICYYHPSLNKFNQVRYPMPAAGSNGPYISIKCLAEDRSGRVFVGTTNGVCLFDPVKKISQPVEALNFGKKEQNNVWIQALTDRKDRVWLASFYFGLVCYDHGKVSVFRPDSRKPDAIPECNIRSIFIDSKNRFWVAPLNYGVGLFDSETGHFERLIDRYPNMRRYKHVASMTELRNGDILFASTKGLFKLDGKTNRFVFTGTDLLKLSRSLAQINNVYQDSRGLLWLCTQDGLCCYNGRNHNVAIYHIEDGLPNNCVQSIEEDNYGKLWLSTSKGISRLTVRTQDGTVKCSFTNFSEYDGLQGLSFNFHAYLKAHDGTLYFGGTNGFSYFKPAHISFNASAGRPIITGINLFNKPVLLNQAYHGRVILTNAIYTIPRIKLHHNENFISLDFSALNFLDPEQTVYRYKLEGVDANWVELKARQGRAVYTDLKPGTYTFLLQSSINGNDWTGKEARLEIVIKPPFWASTIAYVLYCLLMAWLAFQLWQWLKRKGERLREQEKLKEKQRQREELDQMKFRFFTNISHEFRTPLTLILTPLENLVNHLGESGSVDAESMKHQLSSIYRNAQNLLVLVNQLLDFRRLEMKGEKLKLTNGDIVEFAESICLEFAGLAKLKDIYLFFETPEKSVYMGFDKDKMRKILNNLLSNAIKFTPQTGTIKIELKKEWREVENREMLKISVADNGEGIPTEDLPHIFERFYQSGPEKSDQLGSGIGLHLVKEYLNMHKATIDVTSSLGKGSTFTLFFPLDLGKDRIDSSEQVPVREEQTEQVVTAETETKAESVNGSQKAEERRRILIVEDNQEFREFLKEQLAKLYIIYEAKDGVDGYDFAVENQPDLIVSDLMMPKRNGLELCKLLKSDLKTSHIPFILLTARSTDDMKLTGYEVGADYYITKPFNLDILLVRIAALIENQNQRQALFRKRVEVVPREITVTSLDEKLIQKALDLVEKNLANADYSVDDLAADIGMSRGHLYRKLMAITGTPPIEFIRTIRLKRAAMLLKNSQLNVNEISYMVGFSSPKYFRKYFKDEFGVSPSHYAGGKEEDLTAG
ncbi:MAG: two-component regulator propeller domain-containing protein [Bacteroidota bacterium]|nr:two-component regulator propeller domain-containing protein [Bacteroidota bacterium]